MNKIITKYRIYRINNSLEIINAAIDYKNKETGEYYDYIWEHEAKDKAYELNQIVENPEVEFWYRAIEENTRTHDAFVNGYSEEDEELY